MHNQKIVLALSLTLGGGVFGTTLAHANPFEFEFEKLAPGVWTAIRPDSSRFPVMGNATFVIGETGVLVFDGGGVPGMADQVIEKIKSLTDLPVSHVVISHWHGDHNFGVFRFEEEYDQVTYIAHEFTTRAMDSHKIDYILNYPTFVEKRLPAFKEQVESGKNSDGSDLSDGDRAYYQRMIDDAPLIDKEYKAVRLVEPDISIDGNLTLHLGDRQVEIHSIGHGNTEGDLIMWLPDERIVAAGDLIVAPSPYAFNVPPRAWAQTLKNLNALDYKYLVPGHGKVQINTDLVDLTIKAAESIANQRDALIAEGLEIEAVEKQLSLSDFEQAYTGGDPALKITYDQWFAGPLIKAAMKEMTGEPMVALKPRAKTEP